MKNIVVTFYLLLFPTVISAQYIPNGGFENWDTINFPAHPLNWSSLIIGNCTSDELPSERSNDSYTGNWAVEMVTHTCQGFPGPQIELGFIFTGNYGGGYPPSPWALDFSESPEELNFYYKFHPEGNDSAYIRVMLFKYDTIETEITDTVAFSTGYIFMEKEEYTQFTLPITYLSENTPDYIHILFTTSKTLTENILPPIPNLYAHIGTTLVIDNVSVSGGTLGINSETNFESSFKVYPNPVYDVFSLEKPEQIQIQQIHLFSNLGKEITRFSGSQSIFDVSGINPGLYFLKLNTNQGVVIKKIVIK
jgi:hypothetical protein